MDTRATLWCMFLAVLVGYWFYANSHLEIDYERYFQLVDEKTGLKHKPSELLDLGRIIKHTPGYINSTNAIERLYDLAYLSSFENPFIIDQSYSSQEDLLVSGWPAANQTRCSNHLDWIHKELTTKAANGSGGGSYSSIRGRVGYDLTNFMDSFGRPESGLFSGSIHWLGSYKNCLSSRLMDGHLKTRYCIIRLRFKSWPERENIYPQTRLRMGVCLPETCDTLSYATPARRLIDRLARFDMPQQLSDQVEFDSLVCLPDERSPLRKIPSAGRAYLVIVGAWLAIVLAATVVYETIIRHDQKSARQANKQALYESHAASGLGKQQFATMEPSDEQPVTESKHLILEQIICAIAIRTSIKSFKANAFRVKYHQGHRVRLNLGVLDFLKVNMALLVVLAHAGYLASVHMRSLGNRVELNTSEIAMMGMTVGRCVDTFFLFFGILTSYNLLKKFPNERYLSSPLVWLAINVGILVRVAPLFMLVFWYSKLLAPFTSSGPWWDYGIDNRTAKGICLNEPWWKSLPHLGSSGHPSLPVCNLPAWFIVSYSQISLLLPLITYLVYKLPTGRWARCTLVASLLAASAGSIGIRLAKQTTIREEGATLYGAFLVDLLEKFESTGHLTTLGRIGAASLGCLVGYLLLMYEQGQIQSWPKWVKSKWTNWLGVIALVVMVMLPCIGHRLYLLTGKMATWNEFVGTNVLLIIVWPIVCSVLVVSWTTVYNHTVWVRFLSHSFWHVFNRLGLCIFLIHWEILSMVITGFEQAPSHGFLFDIMKFWAFGVFFSIIFSLPIHILIEAPISKLLMIVYRRFTSSLPHQDELSQFQQQRTESIKE